MAYERNSPGCGSFILLGLGVLLFISTLGWAVKGCSNIVGGKSFTHENAFIEPKEEMPPPTSPPRVAENGDIRGADNDGDGRPEPIYVRGYYRKDGTYVRSHYRAAPGE